MQQYRAALYTYLSKCNPYVCPVVFEYPFLFFYRGAKDSIRTIVFYPYGSQKKSNRLTKEGFPYLLQAIFSPILIQVPTMHFPTKGTEVEDLYSSLQNLILKYPYDRLTLILEELRKYMPSLAAEFSLPSAFRYSSEGNIYSNTRITDHETHIAFFPSILGFDFLSKRQNEKGQYVPTQLLKNYFYEIIKRALKDSTSASQPTSASQLVIKKPCSDKELFARPNLYVQQANLRCVRYDQDTDFFQHLEFQDSYEALGYQPKIIPLPYYDVSDFSKTVLSFFNSILGNDLSLLEQFIFSLTDAMLTDGPRFLVLHTKAHKKELQSFFSDVLSPTAVKIDFQPHYKAKQRTCLTLTQLTKSPYLRALFLAQSAGKCTVLVDDVLPSDASLSTLRKLISGKHISINSDFAPPQHHYNRLCVVCVTDNYKKAKYFQKKLRANMIDFSHSESDVPRYYEFEADDSAWIYSTLIPYGLKLKTLQETGQADPAPFDFPHTPTPPTEEECIHSFLKLCQKQKDCLCTTSEVYDSYCQFLAVTHAGRSPSLTKTMFNKKFKALTKARFVFKRPHKSRTSPSPYCYIGLKLPEAFPPPVVPICVSQESLLRQYLEHISKYRIKHDGLRVKVNRTAKE